MEKIKDIIEYYKTKRSQIKSSKSKWSTKGSIQFLKNTVAEYIINNYTKNPDTFQRYKQDYQELSSFQSHYKIEYNGLYDTKSYANEEISINNEDFTKSEDDYTLSSLPITAFSDYNRSTSTLISELKKDLFKKYVSLNNTYYATTTSVDIDSTTPFHDIQNRTKPLISRISTTDGLLTQGDIGYYFTSRFIMASKYISPKGISLKDTDGFIGLVPKIDVYYEEDYVDYYLWAKYDSTYGAMSNKPVKNKRLKRFHGYESRNVRVGDSSGGVSRYTDNIQLWTGPRNEQWANDDLFDKFIDNVLNRDNKNNYLFNLDENESVYKYSVDIFGNEYYLIKEIDEQQSSQSNIYPLKTFTGGASQLDFILLGQRYSNIDPLSAVELGNDIALGFENLNQTEYVIETLSDYHLDDREYYTLDSSNYNTETLSSNSLSSEKSLYEYGLTAGKLVVRTSGGKKCQNYYEFIDDVFDNYANLYSQLSSGIIDFDISGDVLIVKTEDYLFTNKIRFDYSQSDVNYVELNKNVLSSYNDPLNKTAKYWYSSKDDSVYFANISANDDYIIPSVYKLKIGENVINTIDIEDIPLSSYQYDYPLEVETISQPNIIKSSNSIYITTLIKDICSNYFINVIEFSENRDSILNLVNNTIYKQDYQLLSDDLLSSDSLTSLHSEVQSSLSSDLVYYSTESGIRTEPIPEFILSSYDYYDNDSSSIVTKSKPSLEYDLSDIVDTLTLSSITVEENSYFYTTGKIYTPSNIVLDVTNLSSFSTFVPSTEHIIKIEYSFGNEVFIRNISNQNLKDVLYDSTFVLSPLNQTDYVYENKLDTGTNAISIRLYSSSNKIFTFEFQIDQWAIDIPNRFAKLELLDSRINVTDSGNNLVVYLNSRKPDYIIPLKIINI